MEEKKMVEITNLDGNIESVEVITYLISDDGLRNYLVYSKGEVQGVEEDHVIYISLIVKDGDVLTLKEIVDDAEWSEVQKLLKKIANS